MRNRKPEVFIMRSEGFRNKDDRDARHAKLKSEKAKHLNRFSTYEGGKSLWVVIYAEFREVTRQSV